MAHGNDRNGIQLTRGAAREIARQSVRVQRDYLNSAGSDFRPRTQPLIVMKAIVSSASITVCSGTTPGTGTATIQFWDGTSITAGDDVTVLNWFTVYSPVTGAHIKIYWEDNAYWLGPGDC